MHLDVFLFLFLVPLPFSFSFLFLVPPTFPSSNALAPDARRYRRSATSFSSSNALFANRPYVLVCRFKWPRNASIGWLNDVAFMNMASARHTWLQSRFAMGWLKAAAPTNMAPLLVTRAVFSCSIGWLNDVAPLNIEAMVATRLVSNISTGRL